MAQRFVSLLTVSIPWMVCPIVGCVQPEPTKSINIPSLSKADENSTLGEFFAYQNDQGMLADLSISDIHFVPHTARLSGTGQARLERYAELLADTGGRLRYSTSLHNKKLILKRMAIARGYLAGAYPGRHRIDIVMGMPGGRGMSADEATAAAAVAQQPEPRGEAYHLSDTTDVRAGE